MPLRPHLRSGLALAPSLLLAACAVSPGEGGTSTQASASSSAFSATSPARIAQLTGRYDMETCHAVSGTCSCATSPFDTSARYGILSTDEGQSFLYNGALYFAFGDAWRTDGSAGPDALGYTYASTVASGLALDFVRNPPRVPTVDLGFMNIPSEGFGVGNRMYVFFKTDFAGQPSGPPLGRSVLSYSTDGGNTFAAPLYTFSTDKFQNLSAQIVPGGTLPGVSGEALLVMGNHYWAEGKYLAYVPLANVTDVHSFRYLSGYADAAQTVPTWSTSEAAAIPIPGAADGATNDFNLRWNDDLRKWMLLATGWDNTELCLADAPWAGWSCRWISTYDAGYNVYRYVPGGTNECLKDGPNVPSVGHVYGAYQLAPYESGIRGVYSKIYFSLSIGDPYNTILVSADVSPDGQALDDGAWATGPSAPNDRKFGNLAMHLARLGAAGAISWDAAGQGSTLSPDHIEWARAHVHAELQTELLARFAEVVGRVPTAAAKADAYASVTVAAAALGANDPYANVGYANHYGWALDAVNAGHADWLQSEMTKRLTSSGLFPDHDADCYAEDPDAPNARKFARTYEAISGQAYNSSWMNLLVRYGATNPVSTLRSYLQSTFQSYVSGTTLTPAQKAAAYARATIAMVTLGADGPYDVNDYNAHYTWALNSVNAGNTSWLVSETNLRVARGHFLRDLPR